MASCLNRGRISLCLMYLSVVFKHHRGCHQVQRGEIVGNMMQSVVLDGNPLDEDDGNLLNEVVLDA